MRILLANIFHYFRGGDSTYTFSLADLLRSYGHDVKHFAMKHPLNISCAEEKYFLDYIDYAELNKNKSIPNALKVLTRSIYYKQARVKIRDLINDFKPDIVHLQNIHAHITPSILFEFKKFNIPVVWTLHDYKMICPNTHYLIDRTLEICEACKSGSYYQAVIKRCKKESFWASLAACIEAYSHRIMGIRNLVNTFLTPSRFLRNKLIQYGFNSDIVVHLPLFLSDDKFDYNENNEGYILYFGRIDYIKGVITLLQACKNLKNVKVVIAGRISERIEQEFNDLISKNVTYVGFKSGDELTALKKGALAVVVPSICYENQPFSILEAFALGTPVIGSRIGGIPELVKNGETGLLFEPGNAEDLKEKIQYLFNNPVLCKQMGSKCIEFVKENNSAEIHYNKLIELYSCLS